MTREYHGIQLTESFDDRVRAKKVLEYYFRPLSGENAGYTGALWDTFDPSGTRASKTDEFTADDLVACALLSAEIPGRAALELLERQRPGFKGLLQAIGADRPFVEEDNPARFDFQPVQDLYWQLRKLPHIGMTRATKLIARKRPCLVPIVDGIIDQTIFNQSGSHWAPLHAALTADDCWLWKELAVFKELAVLPHTVPTVRVFDVLAWMDGTDRYRNAL